MRTKTTRPPIGRAEDPPDDRELYGPPQHVDASDDERRLYGEPQHGTRPDGEFEAIGRQLMSVAFDGTRAVDTAGRTDCGDESNRFRTRRPSTTLYLGP